MTVSCRAVHSPNTLPAKQKGVALIIVVFVTALIVIITTGVTRQQNLFVRKSANLFSQAQAVELAISAELFARVGLARDFDEDKKDKKYIDHEKEIWAEYAATFPMELGTIEIQVDDLQGRFNINDLVDDKGVADEKMVQRLQDLLDALGVVSVNAEKFVDWVDTDEESYKYKGAEDDVYLLSDPPYRTPNSGAVHLSEMLLISEITLEEYEKLAPHMSVLPRGTLGLNINTCTPELLMALYDKLSLEDAKEVVELRREDPFEQAQDLYKTDAFKDAPQTTRLTVKTNFFQISTRITLGDKVVRMVSVVHRDANGRTELISRDFGQKYIINKQQVLL